MVDAEEDAHVGADFGDDDRANQPIDPGNGHQQGHLGAVGPQSFPDPRVEGGSIGFDRLNAAETRYRNAGLDLDNALPAFDQCGAVIDPPHNVVVQDRRLQRGGRLAQHHRDRRRACSRLFLV